MPSCRKLWRAVLTAAMALAFVALPFRVTLKGGRAELSLPSAFAKDGNGKGGGNCQGKGNGQGNGNSKGGAGKSEADGKGSSGKSAAIGDKPANPSPGATVQVSGSNIDVLHRNGMREAVKGGRYTMKDGKGRTIIERRATAVDAARLRSMM